MDIGQKIKEYRSKVGLTQAQFSEKVNVHYQTVSKWERGTVQPDFGSLGEICKTLKISLEDLLGVSANKNIENGYFNISQMGKAIASLRNSLNQSQAELAKALGVFPDTVSKWERGKICPDVDRLIELSNYFKVSPSEIYYGQITVDREQKPKSKKKFYLKLAIISLLIIVVTLSAVLIPVLTYKGENYDNNNNNDYGEITFTKPLETLIIERDEMGMVFSESLGRYEYHGGIDFKTTLGEKVYSVISGKVVDIIQAGVFGNGIENLGVEITIAQGDYKVTYWSVVINEDIAVGSMVTEGQCIGLVGNHEKRKLEKDDKYSLHLQMTFKDEIVNPLDYILDKE